MKKTISLLLTIFLFVTVWTPLEASASDYEDHWAKPYIDLLISQNVVEEDSNGIRPDDPLLRSEFVKMVNRVFGFQDNGQIVSFADVKETDWYYQDFSIAVQKGYLKGDGTYFYPESNITRAEMAAVLGRILGQEKNGTTQFLDDAFIPLWAKGAVHRLCEMGILSGYEDNTYRSEAVLLRSEGFTVLSKIIDIRFAGGSGTEEDPYLIAQPHQLMNIGLDFSAHYRIVNDLDFLKANLTFHVIGEEGNAFRGVLDGGHYRIIGLSTPQSGKFVLFDQIHRDGVVKNVRLINPQNFFSIARENAGLIQNCSNTTFSGQQQQFSEYKGGIAGINTGNIFNSYNTSEIVARPGDRGIGGIAGYNSGHIVNCFNTGNSASDNAAGIVFTNEGTVENSFNTGNLTGANAQAIAKSAPEGMIGCAYLDNMNGSMGNRVNQQQLREIYAGAEWEYKNRNQIPTLVSNPFLDNEDFVRFYGGDGSVLNPYRVDSSSALGYVGDFPEDSFLQIQDIDFSLSSVVDFNHDAKGFSPIGTAEKPFTGVYDGGGFMISGLKMLRGNEDDVGLFGWNQGEIKNVNLINSYLEGNRYVGGIAARNRGIIRNCSNAAKIVAVFGAGIAATNEGVGVVINNCYNQGEINSTIRSAGITLSNEGTISDCYNTGTILSKFSAGIVCNNYGLVERVYNIGDIVGSQAGALLGSNDGGSIYQGYYLEGLPFSAREQGEYQDVTSRTQEQLQYASAFYGFDFQQTWTFVPESGYTSPQLKNVPHFALNMEENTTEFAGGSGTIDDPYRIVTPIHLNNVRYYPDSNFVLMNSIDLAAATAPNGLFYHDGRGFEPIQEIRGIFDGSGYQITGLKMDREGNAGLFQNNLGVVLNLWINNAQISGNLAGSIAAINSGSILGCKNTSSVSAVVAAGGIAGINYGSISSSANAGTIEADQLVAGIAGCNYGQVADTFNTGDIIGTSGGGAAAGIATGASGVFRSYQAGRVFFAKEEGEKYPISNGSYQNSYYIKASEDNFAGGIIYAAQLSEEQFNGFDFDGVWTMGEAGFPLLSRLNSEGFSFPNTFTKGDGSQENPFRIMTIEDLDQMRLHLDAHFILGRELDFTGMMAPGEYYYNGGRGFLPIGTKEAPFTGTLDGNDYGIRGLEMVQPDEENIGLFGFLSGTVENLDLWDCHIEGKENVGAVAGSNMGSVKNITVHGSRIGAAMDQAGGIVGTNLGGGLVEACVNESDVFSSNYTGGIAGANQGVILDNINLGGIITTSEDGETASGGIAGLNRNAISRCVNNGKIVAYSDTGTAISGGIAGVNESIISTSYNTGELSSKTKNRGYVGGIVGFGRKNMDVSQVYNTGYSVITAGESFQGSLVGGGGDGNLRNSYYDHTLTRPVGDNNISMNAVEGLSPEDLTNPDKLEKFDFENTWEIDLSAEYQLPQLKARPHLTKQPAENIKDFAGGDGTLMNPFRIMTPEQLNNVRKYLGATYMLMGDVDMTNFCKENEFIPIGDQVFSFFGTFLGNDYVISGISIDQGTYGGLFRQNHGEIYNVGMDRCSFQTDISGMLAGMNTGLIYNCYSLCDLSFEAPSSSILAGGLVGLNKHTGMIISSYVTGDIQVTAESVQTGGVVYGNYGVIAGCYYDGKLEAVGEKLAMAGGIAGFNYGTISDSYNTNRISVLTNSVSDTVGGGIAGASGGLVVNCYNSSPVVIAKTYGAIVGDGQNGQINNCYYRDEVEKGVTGGKTNMVLAKSAEEMQQKETYQDFDFDNMWMLYPESGYPFPQFMAIPHRT